jgi:hypothetical protein
MKIDGGHHIEVYEDGGLFYSGRLADDEECVITFQQKPKTLEQRVTELEEKIKKMASNERRPR